MSPNEIDSLGTETLKGLVLSLLAKIDALEAENKALKTRIAELEAVRQAAEDAEELIGASVTRPQRQRCW